MNKYRVGCEGVAQRHLDACGRNRAEVIVVGGGTAGVAAALAAARRGADTLLIEKATCLGGTQTLGLVMPIMKTHIDGRWITRGLHIEMQSRYAAAIGEPDGDPEHDRYRYTDPVVLSDLYAEMLAQDGVRVLLDASVTEAGLDGSRISEVQILAGGTPGSASAAVFVDCTGDANLAVLSGVSVRSGRETDGAGQAMSLRFNMGNVDIPRAKEFFADLEHERHAAHPQLSQTNFYAGYMDASNSVLRELVSRAVQENVLEPNDLGYYQMFEITGRPGVVSFNCPRLTGYDANDPAHRSQALHEGRRKIRRIVKFTRRFIHGFEDSYVTIVASMLGVRESNRIVGLYTLTEDDVLSARKFEDGIGRCNYPVDIHSMTPGGAVIRHIPAGDYYDIPYRCLVPEGPENLLVAGRCISADFVAQASVRVQSTCRVMGEAAGAAAALAAGQNGRVANLDPQSLRADLAARGALV